MGYIIIAIIIYLVIRSLRNKNGARGNTGGNNNTKTTTNSTKAPADRNRAPDEYVNRVFYAFELIRDHHQEFDTGIGITDGFIVMDGKPTGELTKRLTVRVDDESGRCVDLARQLGMRITYHNGRYIYDYDVSGFLNKTQKRDALNRLKVMIESRYPNDYVEVDKGLLYDFVDRRHIMQHLGRA